MSRALLKFVRVSPVKARLVAREVQGMNAELALAALEFMPNKAAGIISGVIASAVANGEYEPEEVVITSCRVDKAAVMKRWRPRARGTASRIIKPTAHILVEVATIADVETARAKAAEARSASKSASEKKSDAKSKGAAKRSDTRSKASSKKTDDAKAKTATAKKAAQKKASDASQKNADAKKDPVKPSDTKTKSTTNKKAAPKKETKGDDLTKIKGIGKVYAGKLNDEGIFTYADVANMSDEQIQLIEEKYTFRGDFRESVTDAKNIVNGKES